MTPFDAALHPRGQAQNAGQFSTKRNSAPVGLLRARHESPGDEANDFVNAPVPDGLTGASRQAYEDANAELSDPQLFKQQPLSYIGFLAEQQHKSAVRRLEMTAPDAGDVRAYWETRAARFDEIADELYRLADANRYPNRAPENVGDDTRDGFEVVREVFAEYEQKIVSVDPVGLTATRSAVTNRRGEPDGAIRLVALTWDSVPPASGSSSLEVAGPNDGRPIVIDVRSGCPTMTVTSGHAVILVGGNGFGIDVADGARATVIAQPGKKVSLTGKTGSTIAFYPDRDTRGYQHIEGGATFRMHGRADDISMSTDRRERP